MGRAHAIDRAEAAALLGVPPDADPATVRHAWRMWARIAHPDVGGDPTHFGRLEEARRVLLQPLPVPIEPEPRAPWSSVIRRPRHGRALALAFVAAVALALLPAVSSEPLRLLALAAAAMPAAVAAAAWAGWAAHEVLGTRADRGHRIAALALMWLPVAIAQQVLSGVVGASLIPVLPLLALPLAAAVATVNPGAGLWRPVGETGP